MNSPVQPGPDIGYLLNRATRRFRLKLAEALKETGLTPQQAAVLMAIPHGGDGRLTPRGIAEAIDTDQATTSGLLDRLVRDGWLVSAPNPDDGRSRLFGRSEKAAEALPAVLSSADNVSAEATACLTADERRVLGQLLLRLCSDDMTVTPGQKAEAR